MILQALYDYYQRKPELPKFGFETKEFKFQIVLESDGTFFNLEKLLVDKKTGQFFQVPRSRSRSGKNAFANPYLLWDHYGFVLGQIKPSGGTAAEIAADRETAEKQHSAFLARLNALPEDLKAEEGIHAVLEFYRRGEDQKVFLHQEWPNCLSFPGCNLCFRLKDDPYPVTSRPEVIRAIGELAKTEEENGNDKKSVKHFGRCLVTGEAEELSRLMNPTPIPNGKSNAALVSFQSNSGYDSYGKEQCYNAPLGKTAEFACVTALNSLLGKKSRNKFTMGNITVLFWADRNPPQLNLEEILPLLIRADKDNPDKNIEAVRKMLLAAYDGSGLPADDRRAKFYFLGLSPNAARISVQFFRIGTVGELAEHIAQHYRDFELVHGPKEPDYPNLSALLCCTALDYKMENVPPNLQPQVLESIFWGEPYPAMLLLRCMNRIRATREITRNRAGICKAFLNRKNRYNHNQTKEFTMSFDPDYPSEGYQCGALFAVLEKAQIEALGNINAGIRERYFGAASATPLSVFAQLIKLNLHHLGKLVPARETFFRKEIGEIMNHLKDFPAVMPLEEQARFALGYYQKMQTYYHKNEENSEKQEEK